VIRFDMARNVALFSPEIEVPLARSWASWR